MLAWNEKLRRDCMNLDDVGVGNHGFEVAFRKTVVAHKANKLPRQPSPSPGPLPAPKPAASAVAQGQAGVNRIKGNPKIQAESEYSNPQVTSSSSNAKMDRFTPPTPQRQ
ncbi:hypothetical protein BG000_008698 [Podila horticola]|nr:hypothetical protein BG000_008698 [Podila horticola]